MSKIKFTKKWCEALRSGKYLQCLNTMHCNGKYCCLGVAACVAYEMGLISKASLDDNLSREDPGGSLSELLRKYYGASNPGLDKGFTCVCANDMQGLSFSEIADAIEETYLREEI